MSKYLWFVTWGKGNSTWGYINGDNCIMFNLGRITMGIQKPNIWKHLG